MLRIAVSSRSLFNTEDSNEIFERQGQDAFNQYMLEKEDIPLRPGPAFNLVKKLLHLNTLCQEQVVDVVLLSRNSPNAGMRVMNSIEHYGLNVERAWFCQGTDRFRYAEALNTHLFLSANQADVRAALAQGLAAATMVAATTCEQTDGEIVKIAFDGDSVLFSSEADDVFRAGGLDAFRKSESSQARVPLGDGPLKKFFSGLHEVQEKFPAENSPLRIALVTARGLPSHGRVIHTLRHWGIQVHEAIFAGGLPKGPLLRAFGADMFFDDTQKNVDSARDCEVAAAHVPFGQGGILPVAPIGS